MQATIIFEKKFAKFKIYHKETIIISVFLSLPQILAELKGFLGIHEEFSQLHHNFSDFELEEKISVESSGILRTGTVFGRISAKLQYITSSARGHMT